jgi:putative ABC transport system permease protein
MVLLSLAWKSLNNRRLTTGLTILSIALSVALMLGIENVRQGARESFTSAISGTDLIVGARGGSLQLLLYAVFRIGSATNNVSYETYQHWKNHRAVAWTIPYSLGDGHRGFRVVGTTEEFYKNYRYRRGREIRFQGGRAPGDVFELALGSDVAKTLGYTVGQKVAITHGLGASGIMDHSDKPFTVVGILERTATPVDRSLYIPLEGMAAVHVDWQDGAPPMLGEGTPASEIRKDTVKIDQVTAILVRCKSRIDALRLQREINT